MTIHDHCSKSVLRPLVSEPDRVCGPDVTPTAASEVDEILAGLIVPRGPQRVGGGVEAGTATAVTTTAHAAGPPEIDLGDQEVDCGKGNVTGCRQFFQSVAVSNLHTTYEAYPTFTYDGDPAIQIVAKPSRLRPSREGVDPGAALKLAFSPKARGVHRGVITVQLTWQRDVAPEELRIPVVARAHLPGEPTHAEAAAKEASEQKQHEDADAKAAADAKAKKEMGDFEEENPNALGDRLLLAAAAAGAAAKLIADNQSVGVRSVESEVAKFKRKKPPKTESSWGLMFDLAMLAITLGSSGIAGGVAKGLESVLMAMLTTSIADHTDPKGRAVAGSTTEPAKAVVGLFTNAVKQGVKMVGGEIVKSLQSSDPQAAKGDGPPPLDRGDDSPVDQTIHFFQVQAERFNTVGTAREAAVADSALTLGPIALVDKALALRMIEATTEQLNSTAKHAANTQGTETAREWARFIAHIDVGEEKQDGHEPVTKMKALQTAPRENSAIPTGDGVVDVGFEAVYDDPTRPVTVRKAIVRGVSNDIAARFARRPLLDQGVPVRACGLPSPGVAVMPVTVTRDEAGNIGYTDQTKVEWERSNWLARKVGARRGSNSEQRAGARKLIEDEIMSTLLPVPLETDHEDPKA